MSDELEKLLLNLYTPAEAFEWLFTPQPVFDGMSAMEIIALGAKSEVLRALRQIKENSDAKT